MESDYGEPVPVEDLADELRGARDSRLLLGLLQYVRREALACYSRAAEEAADGKPAAFQLGAGRALEELLGGLGRLAMEDDGEPDQRRGID
jgi:hypothetical protein